MSTDTTVKGPLLLKVLTGLAHNAMTEAGGRPSREYLESYLIAKKGFLPGNANSVSTVIDNILTGIVDNHNTKTK